MSKSLPFLYQRNHRHSHSKMFMSSNAPYGSIIATLTELAVCSSVARDMTSGKLGMTPEIISITKRYIVGIMQENIIVPAPSHRSTFV